MQTGYKWVRFPPTSPMFKGLTMLLSEYALTISEKRLFQQFRKTHKTYCTVDTMYYLRFNNANEVEVICKECGRKHSLAKEIK